MAGKTPDYELKIKHKDAKYGTRVGVAWRTQDGSGVNIRLDPGVSVSTPDGVFLTLWPFESKESRDARFSGGQRSQGGSQHRSRQEEPPPGDDEYGSGSIPF